MRAYKDVDFVHLELDVIVDFISKKCDAEIKQLLEMTHENFKIVERTHEPVMNLLILINKFGDFKDILEYHIRKEELILFPFLKKYSATQSQSKGATDELSPKLHSPIEIIKSDHQKILIHLDSLKTYYDDFTESGNHMVRLCIASLMELDTCIKENVWFHQAVLFPKILSLQSDRYTRIN